MKDGILLFISHVRACVFGIIQYVKTYGIKLGAHLFVKVVECMNAHLQMFTSTQLLYYLKFQKENWEWVSKVTSLSVTATMQPHTKEKCLMSWF